VAITIVAAGYGGGGDERYFLEGKPLSTEKPCGEAQGTIKNDK